MLTSNEKRPKKIGRLVVVFLGKRIKASKEFKTIQGILRHNFFTLFWEKQTIESKVFSLSVMLPSRSCLLCELGSIINLDRLSIREFF